MPSVVEPGDEPDRPYDFSPPVKVRPIERTRDGGDGPLDSAAATPPAPRTAAAPSPEAESLEAIAAAVSRPAPAAGPLPGVRRAAKPPPAPPATNKAAAVAVRTMWGDAGWREALWPAAIVVVAALISYVSASTLSHNFHGSAAAGYVLLGVFARVTLLVLTCIAGARLSDISFGPIGPAIAKLAAIAVAPMGVIGLALFAAAELRLPVDGGLTDMFNGNLAGGLINAAVALGAYLLLFYRWFDIEMDLSAWAFLLIAWLVVNVFGGLALHLILDPPPRVPPYVPDKEPMHFSIGN